MPEEKFQIQQTKNEHFEKTEFLKNPFKKFDAPQADDVVIVETRAV
jgi:gluconate kinase